MSVGKNIKKFRKLNKLTQEELALKMGVSDKTISSWEVDRTEPDIGTIQQLADFFGCELTDLIGESNQTYYLNEEVRQIAQELFDRKELRILFDTTRKVKVEDIKYIQDLANRLKND